MLTHLFDRSQIPKRSLGFNFNEDTVRGVNIGGWLLLEPYAPPFVPGSSLPQDGRPSSKPS